MQQEVVERRLTAQQTVIYLHIPKAAGTTLHRIIKRQYPPDAVFEVDPGAPDAKEDSIHALKALSDSHRSRIRFLTGHVPFGVHQWVAEPALYVTLLRDPVERAISDYYYIRNTPQHPFHQQMMVENLSLEDTVRVDVEANGNNLQTRWVSGYAAADHSLPPYDPLPEDALQRAKQNVENWFAIAGVVERFDETLLLMKRHFGWRNVYYTKANVTRGRPAAAALPAATVAFIREHNALDMELWAFCARRLEEQVRALGASFQLELLAFRASNKVHSVVKRDHLDRYADALRRGKARVRAALRSMRKARK